VIFGDFAEKYRISEKEYCKYATNRRKMHGPNGPADRAAAGQNGALTAESPRKLTKRPKISG
jgi:hypothetical protein